MRSLLQYLMLLSLVVWLGGILFFSAVTAPAVFGVLAGLPGGSHLAGEIVRRSLGSLHWMGLICGAAFLLSSTVLHRTLRHSQNYLIVMMMVLTSISQFLITPRIEQLRNSPQLLQTAQGSARFDLLHQSSVTLEGCTLLLGLAVLWLSLRRGQK